MKNYKRVEIDNEKIYLKKDWTGWRVIEPITDPETKVFIWKNFLSKKSFLLLIVLLIIFLSLYLAFQEQYNNYKNVIENPCDFCYQDNINEVSNFFELGGEKLKDNG